MKKSTCSKIGCLLLIVLPLFCYETYKGCVDPDWFCLIYLLFTPKDLEYPLVKDEVNLDREGFERVYCIKPKYRGYYDIFIRFINYDINKEKIKNECDGEIEIILLHNNRVIEKKLIHSFEAYQSSSNDKFDSCDWFDSLYLMKFNYHDSFFRSDVNEIRIKVNKPIRCFPGGEDKKMYLVIEYAWNL